MTSSFGGSIDLLIGWSSIGRSIGWSVGRSVGRSVDSSVSRSINRSVDQWSLDWLINQSIKNSKHEKDNKKKTRKIKHKYNKSNSTASATRVEINQQEISVLINCTIRLHILKNVCHHLRDIWSSNIHDLDLWHFEWARAKSCNRKCMQYFWSYNGNSNACHICHHLWLYSLKMCVTLTFYHIIGQGQK